MKFETKPNLFLVGAPKCGTTSLHRYLSGHPEVFMSPKKEPRYFCKDFIEESDNFASSLPASLRKPSVFGYRTESDYASLFASAENYPIRGESSPVYLYSKVAAGEIARFNPDARFIILLRNPIDFLYSLHSQYLLGGTETEPSFEKALALEEDRKDGRSIPLGVGCPSFLYYSQQARFSEQVKRYIDSFGASRLHVLPQEKLRSDLAFEFRKILKFLSVDPEYLPPPVCHNRNRIVRYPRVKKLLTDPRVTSIPRRIVPGTLYRRVSSAISRAFQATQERPPLSTNLAHRLRAEYESEVAELNALLADHKLIDVDLRRLWGFEG